MYTEKFEALIEGTPKAKQLYEIRKKSKDADEYYLKVEKAGLTRKEGTSFLILASVISSVDPEMKGVMKKLKDWTLEDFAFFSDLL